MVKQAGRQRCQSRAACSVRAVEPGQYRGQRTGMPTRSVDRLLESRRRGKGLLLPSIWLD